jgi:hypothetical protein
MSEGLIFLFIVLGLALQVVVAMVALDIRAALKEPRQRHVCLSPDGRCAYVISDDGREFAVWDLQTMAVVRWGP